MTGLEKLKTEFLEYLEIEKGRSQLTIRNYDFYLRRFFEFAPSASSGQVKLLPPEEITLELIRKYRLWLNRLKGTREENLTPQTQNYHLIALRSFFKYLAKRDIKTLTAEKIELAKIPDRQVSFLEGQDLENFLNAPLQQKTNNKQQTIIQLRDKAILELFFSTGMRVSELAKLAKDDVNLKKDEFTIRGKGGKTRLVFLSNQAKYWIKKYLEARTDMASPLFLRYDKANKEQEDEGLTPRSIQRLVQKYAKMAGITKKVTPHVLRHSFATDLLIGGAGIREVQAMLGHKSLTTTQIYTHVTNRHLKEVYQAFHARRRNKK
jgi:site-specific recombinase XerD